MPCFFANAHELLVEVEIGHVGGRVRRIADHDRQRLRDRMHDRALERREEIGRRLRRHRTAHAARHQEAEGMDRVARVRHQHDVARRGDRLRHIGEAFLGAERGDDLGLGIELHAEAALVIGGLGPAQPGDAARRGIAVGARTPDGVLQLLDDMGGRRQVGIAHAEVDDVGPGIARLGLRAVDLLEDIGRQSADAVEIFHGPGSSAVSRVRLRPTDVRFYHGLRAPPAAGAVVPVASGAGIGADTRLRVFFRSSRRCLLSASLSAPSRRAGGRSWTAG